MNKGRAAEDMGEPSSMICSKHTQKSSSSSNGGSNNTGGICAFCLQEKLGNLVSSSYPNAIFPSSSSSSPSFRSDSTTNAVPFAASSTSLSLSSAHSGRKDVQYQSHAQAHHPRRARFIPFLSAQKKKSRKDLAKSSSSLSHGGNGNIILKRSMSTTTPRRGLSFPAMDDISQGKRFWSFLHHSKTTSCSKSSNITVTSTPSATSLPRRAIKGKDFINDHHEEEDDSPGAESSASTTSFERKVSRSRSVGCGSRSFSGDFFERISTGFGDCTLRRVESQREGKPKVGPSIKERARCGGIFGGFIMTSSSSSSSSSSYWTAAESKTSGRVSGPASHGRNRNWTWALASPLRAFSKPNNNKSNKNATATTPNLAAIPSLLVV